MAYTKDQTIEVKTIEDYRGRPVQVKTLKSGVGNYVMVKTRYGREVHWQDLGSSVTACGHWTKTNAFYLWQRSAKVVTCEKCIAAHGEAFPQ
jgi:hypothetical protein